jgi:hypothetical protein
LPEAATVCQILRAGQLAVVEAPATQRESLARLGRHSQIAQELWQYRVRSEMLLGQPPGRSAMTRVITIHFVNRSQYIRGIAEGE